MIREVNFALCSILSEFSKLLKAFRVRFFLVLWRHHYKYLKVKVKSLSRVQLFATPWTGAYHAPLSMGFSRQEYWSGLPFPSPGDLSDPGIKFRSPAL